MPESCSRRGEPIAPQLRITSRSACKRLDAPCPPATVDADRAAVLDDDLQRLRIEANREILRALHAASGTRSTSDERSALRVES